MRLQLTRRGDYAIRAALSLAQLPEGTVRSARAIAEEMAIPGRLIAQIMAALARAGIVVARPGRTGGYRLARPAGRISVLDVVEAIEGDSRRTTCVLRGGACRTAGVCLVHEVFFGAQEAMLGTLARSSLQEIVNGDRASRL
jgi:Rrf2 family transcriptional regulator, iron-sulfur cluster assembly transcription factor